MKKITFWIVFGLIVCGVFVFTGKEKGIPMNRSQIKIGALLPLTGAGSFFGQEMQNGMKLANKDAGFSLIIEDSQTDPKVGVDAFQKMINTDQVSMSVVSFSSVVGAVMPIAKEKKAPIIQALVSASKIGADNPLSFRYFTSAEQEAPIAAEMATSIIHAKTAAILSLSGEYGNAYTQSFEQAFSKKGGIVIAKEQFQMKDADMRTQLIKIKVKNPDVIYIIGLDPHLPIIFKQIKELEIKSILLTNWVLAAPKVQEATGDLADGVYLTTPSFYGSNKTPEATAFIQRYRAEYGKDPSAYAAIGYDVIGILIQNGKNISDPQLFAKKLKSLKGFSGTMGNLLTDEKGEIVIPLYPAIIYKNQLKILN